MSYRSLGSDEVTLRNYRPVGRRKGNMSLSDPLAAGVVVDRLSGIRIRLPRRRLIFRRYFIIHNGCNITPISSRFIGSLSRPGMQGNGLRSGLPPIW